jgi:hypothetical protein
MKTNLLFCLGLLIVSTFLLFGCSSNPKPYAMPTNGVWSGENGSFTLLENGDISKFSWTLNADEFQSQCPITFNENLPVNDGIANFTLSNQNTGEISFSIQVVFTSPSTAVLNYEYDFCPTTRSIGFDQNGKTRIFAGEAEFILLKP